jgi:WD40 repeat protein
MPAVGRVGFAVANGVRVLDAADGRLVLVASAPRVASSETNAAGMSWNVRDVEGERSDSLTGPVHATADGRFLVGQGNLWQQPVSIWDLHDPRGVLDLPLPGDRARARVGPVQLSLDDQRIAAGMGDGVVLLWTRAGTSIPVSAKHAGGVEALAFSSDSRWLASASPDGVVYVSDATTGRTVGKVSLVADHVIFMSFDAQGRLFLETARRFEITVSVPQR